MRNILNVLLILPILGLLPAAFAADKCLINPGITDQDYLFEHVKVNSKTGATFRHRPLRMHRGLISAYWAQQAIGSLYVHEDANIERMRYTNLVMISDGVYKQINYTNTRNSFIKPQVLDVLPSAKHGPVASYDADTLVTNYDFKNRKVNSLTGSFWAHLMLSEKYLSAAVKGRLIGDFVARNESESLSAADQLNQLQNVQVIFVSTNSVLTSALQNAIAAQAQRGAIVVTGAGAKYPEPISDHVKTLKRLTNNKAIVVGSISPDGLVSPFSQQGPEVDLLAPADEFFLTQHKFPSTNNVMFSDSGKLIPKGLRPFNDFNHLKISKLRNRVRGRKNITNFDYTNGAAAFVAGSIMNMLSEAPRLSPSQVRSILFETVVRVIPGSQPFAGLNGRGMVNAYKSWRVAQRLARNPRMSDDAYNFFRNSNDSGHQVFLQNSAIGKSSDGNSYRISMRKDFYKIIKNSVSGVDISCDERSRTVGAVNRAFLIGSQHRANRHRMMATFAKTYQPLFTQGLSEQYEFYKSMRLDDYRQCTVTDDGHPTTAYEISGKKKVSFRRRDGSTGTRWSQTGIPNKTYIHSRLRDYIIRESNDPRLNIHNAYLFIGRFQDSCLTERALEILRKNFFNTSSNLESKATLVELTIERALAIGARSHKMIQEAFSFAEPEMMVRAIPPIARVAYGLNMQIWRPETLSLIDSVLSQTLDPDSPSYNPQVQLGHVSNNLLLLDAKLTSLQSDTLTSNYLESYLDHLTKNFRLFARLSRQTEINEIMLSSYQKFQDQAERALSLKENPYYTNLINRYQDTLENVLNSASQGLRGQR